MLKSLLLTASLLYVLCDAGAAPKGIACPTLKLQFGRTRYRQRGRFVKFMCNTGYLIAGEKYSTCRNGAWDSPMPKCVRASCTNVNPPINGMIYPSHRGAVLNFFCKPGFELRGPNTTYCDGRTWDNNLPACIASSTKPLLSCDFETEDLCGWNHDLRHDFDWRRMNFKTPSGHLGTGPSFDHTKGEGQNGYYMYIESSSRNENDTARLISPIYDKMNDSDVCLEFFYHMHGASTGQLRVYLKKESNSWVLEPNNALFWKSGNHGDRWRKSLSYIGLIDEDFQIVIEGIRGSSYFSDIAVDDVRIIQNCTTVEVPSTVSDVTYTDDFQKIQSCLNRCDNDNLIIPPADTFQLSCDCDETCIDNNTCCPDYIAICVLGANDDFSSTDVTTTFEQTTKFTDTTTEATTTNLVTPKKNKTQHITSNDINAVLKTIEHDIEQDIIHLKPIKKYNRTTTTNFNRVPQPYKPPTRKPTLIFLTPSTPEIIIKKVKIEPRIVDIPTTRKPTRKPTTIAQTSEGPIDDVATVPQRIEDDKTFFQPVPVTRYPDEHTSGPQAIKQSNKETHQKIVKEPETNAKFIAATVASVSLILLVALSAFALVKRYKLRGCNSRSTMYGSGSDSQSDVRFLTSDEMLDFNIASPDD